MLTQIKEGWLFYKGDLLNVVHLNQYLLFIILFFALNAKCQTQLNGNLAAFSIGKEAGKTDALYQFSDNQANWQKIGHLGTTDIISIAIDSEKFILYAVDGDILGIINPVTASFSAIGNIGTGAGSEGTITINQIYGLTFDPIEKVLYATHRRSNFEDDILLKINPQSGKIIKQELLDTAFNLVDYAVIESSTRATIFPPPPLTETTSILYEPVTKDLFCLQRSLGNIALCIINKLDGRLETVILDLSLTEMFGIGSNSSDELFSTALNYTEQSSLYGIDRSLGEYNLIQPMQVNNVSVEFTGIAFLITPETITTCDNQINLNMSSPQTSLVQARKFIHSNNTVKVNTTYQAEENITLHNHFTAPSNKNLNIEIKEICP